MPKSLESCIKNEDEMWHVGRGKMCTLSSGSSLGVMDVQFMAFYI